MKTWITALADVKNEDDYRSYLNFLWDYYKEEPEMDDDSPILKGKKQIQDFLKKLEEKGEYPKQAIRVTYDILALKQQLAKGLRSEYIHYLLTLIENQLDIELYEQEFDAFYRVINRYKDINVISGDSLKSQIKTAINAETDQVYAEKVSSILSDSTHAVDQRSKDLYRKIFYEDVKRYTGVTKAIALAMYLEGFRDLIDFRGSFIPDGIDQEKKIQPPRTDRELKILEDELFSTLHLNATYDYPLLIVGESGTGKQLLAGVVHTISDRRGEPFVQINCAAIPDTMLEAELFGYEKGAFTDAKRKKEGLFKMAGSGTIFLDEIGKMPPYLQAKLLKVIEENEFRPLASNKVKPIKLNARCIAAVQPDDMNNVITDLKFRLGYPDIIKTKNLNEKIAEIGINIIKSIFQNVRLDMKLRFFNIGSDCYDLLMNCKYEGNFRELENICRAAIKSALKDKRSFINRQDISPFLRLTGVQSVSPPQCHDPLSAAIQDIRLRDIITHANQKRADIVRNKVKDSLGKYRDLKSALLAEGLPQREYQNFWKKLTRITGGNIRDLNRRAAGTG